MIFAADCWISSALASYEFFADATRSPSTSAASVAMKPVPNLTMSLELSLRCCDGRTLPSAEPANAPTMMIASTINEVTRALTIRILGPSSSRGTSSPTSFGKHELHLRTDLPIGPEVRLCDVVVRGHL